LIPPDLQYPSYDPKPDGNFDHFDNFNTYYGTSPETPLLKHPSWNPHTVVAAPASTQLSSFDPTYYQSPTVGDGFFPSSTHTYQHGPGVNFYSFKNEIEDPLEQLLREFSGAKQSSDPNMPAAYDTCQFTLEEAMTDHAHRWQAS